MAPCITCVNNERVGSLPPSEQIYVSDSWRVAHAFGTALPGWLVVVPNTHARALHELSSDAAAELGPLLARLSRALGDVVGCEKSYLAFFAEAEGYEHLHIHVVPRMAWFGPEQRGPKVFSLLGASAGAEIPQDERDTLALRLRDAMQAA